MERLDHGENSDEHKDESNDATSYENELVIGAVHPVKPTVLSISPGSAGDGSTCMSAMERELQNALKNVNKNSKGTSEY